MEVTRKFAFGMKLVQAELDKVMKEIEADKSSGPCKSYKNILAQCNQVHDIYFDRCINILTNASRATLLVGRVTIHNGLFTSLSSRHAYIIYSNNLFVCGKRIRITCGKLTNSVGVGFTKCSLTN